MSLTPVQFRFFEFIKARELARIHKGFGIVPHTNDPILATYSFCNINREHDRVTMYIKEKIRDNKRIIRNGVNNMVLNLCVARIFNSPGTLDEFRYPIRFQDLDHVLKTVEARQKRKLTIFRGAYMMPSHGSPTQLKMAPADYYLKACAKLLNLDFNKATTLEDAALLIQSIHGFGPFLTNQIITDLRYTPFFECAPDWYSFVLGGPGTSRGLCRYYGEQAVISKSQLWMRPRLEEVRSITQTWTHSKVIAEYFLDPNNISNSFCEFDKYERCLAGGRLKKFYRPMT